MIMIMRKKFDIDFLNLHFLNCDYLKKLTKIEVKKMYDNYVEKDVVEMSRLLKSNWINVSDLEPLDKLKFRRFENSHADIFLKTMDMERIGKDIINNGYYFPFIVIDDDGVLKTFHGSHRLLSLKYMMYEDKVYCIHLGDIDKNINDLNNNISKNIFNHCVKSNLNKINNNL